MAQKRELVLALTTGWLWRLIPTGDARRALRACRDAQCPCATQQGSVGSPWGAAVELLPNPAQHRPSPSLASALD